MGNRVGSTPTTRTKKEGMTKGHAFLFGFRGPKARSTLRYFNALVSRAFPAQFPACGREFTRHSACGPEGPLARISSNSPNGENIGFNLPSKKKDTLIVCLSFWKGANKGKRDPAPIGAGSQRCWKTLNIPSFCQPQVAVTLGFLHLLARRAISRTVMTRPTMSVIVSGMNINSPATMK